MCLRALLIAAFLVTSSCASVQRSPSCVPSATGDFEDDDSACEKRPDPTRFFRRPHHRDVDR